MTRHISLQEALDIMKANADDVQSLMDNPDISQFLEDVDDYATDILKDKDSEYLTGCIGFVAAGVLGTMTSEAMRTGDILKMMKMVELVNNESFMKMMTLAFKMSVGLSVIEELR